MQVVEQFHLQFAHLENAMMPVLVHGKAAIAPFLELLDLVSVRVFFESPIVRTHPVILICLCKRCFLTISILSLFCHIYPSTPPSPILLVMT